MKLRNKQTGKVCDAIVREKSNGDGEYSIIVCDLRAIRSARSVSSILGEYDSLAKLYEDWKDYEPVEPLIKDDKIRKAVRAWADANGLNYMNCYESAHAWYLRAFNSREQGIDIEFWGYQLPKGLKDSETYTIVELCGEEE